MTIRGDGNSPNLKVNNGQLQTGNQVYVQIGIILGVIAICNYSKLNRE